MAENMGFRSREACSNPDFATYQPCDPGWLWLEALEPVLVPQFPSVKWGNSSTGQLGDSAEGEGQLSKL